MAKRRAESQTAGLILNHKKSGIDPIYLVAGGRATYRWKDFDKSYNFASDRIAIRGLLAKLWGSKVTGVPFGAISRLPLGSSEKNSHLDVASVESCRVYYKGEGGGFPQVRAMVSLVCSWLVPTHSNYALTTLCGLCAGPCE